MFGRKRKKEVEFAQRTIDDKVGLMNMVINEADTSVWFEDGHFPGASAAVRVYASRVLTTNDIVFLTVNNMPVPLRAQAEEVVPELLQTLSYPSDAIGLTGAPNYYAANNLYQSLMDGNIATDTETDRDAADQVICHGLMRACYIGMQTMGQEAWTQQVVIAVTLASGWLISPERARLPH